MHFCSDELMALLACIPVVGFAVNWVRARVVQWRGRHKAPYCLHGTDFHKGPGEPGGD